jgi:hypothetical protein
MPKTHILPISARRKRSQRGLEAIEFGLWSLLLMPPFVWMFINGFNFIRYNKANDVTRAAAMMYIKNSPVNTIGPQRILKRIANGLDLQVDSGGTIVNNVGSGLIVLTKVQFVGASCSCTNANQYVMTQRFYVGNRSLQIDGQTVESFSGPPPVSLWNSSSGLVNNFTTNTAARVSSAFSSAWGTSLADGQVVFLVETFFRTPALGVGPFDSRGIYNRVYM